MDGELAPFSVTAKTCTPLSPAVNVWSAGKVALGLSVVICTVPRYPVAVLPNVSRAVTVTVPAVPAVTVFANPVTTSVTADAGFTVMPGFVMLSEPSPAVTERVPAVFRVSEN